MRRAVVLHCKCAATASKATPNGDAKDVGASPCTVSLLSALGTLHEVDVNSTFEGRCWTDVDRMKGIAGQEGHRDKPAPGSGHRIPDHVAGRRRRLHGIVVEDSGGHQLVVILGMSHACPSNWSTASARIADEPRHACDRLSAILKSCWPRKSEVGKPGSSLSPASASWTRNARHQAWAGRQLSASPKWQPRVQTCLEPSKRLAARPIRDDRCVEWVPISVVRQSRSAPVIVSD